MDGNIDKLRTLPSTIGVFIANHTVKLVQLVSYKGKTTIVYSSMVAVDQDNSHDLAQAKLLALSKAISGVKSKKVKIIGVINSPKTAALRISIPDIPKKELREAIKWETNEQIHFSLDEAYFDYMKLSELSDSETKRLSVLVTAVEKDGVNELESFFKKENSSIHPLLGQRLSAIIPAALIFTPLVPPSLWKKDSPVAVLHLGEYVTELNVYEDHQIAFSRKVPITSSDFTKVLTAPLVTKEGKVELSYEEAELIKMKFGIPSTTGEQMLHQNMSNKKVYSLLRPKLEQLVNEINRSGEYFREHFGKNFKEVVLFGGGARLKGLKEYLNRELGLDVIVGDLNQCIDVADPELVNFPSKIDRFGLCLGASLYSDQKINVLPKKERLSLSEEWMSGFFKSAMASSIVVLIFLGLSYHIKIKGCQDQMEALSYQYKIINPQLKNLSRKLNLKVLTKRKMLWDEVLKDISNRMPSDMFLYKLELINDHILLSGYVQSKAQSAEKTLSNFMLSLEEGVLKNVILVKSEKVDEGSVAQFQVKCALE